MIYLLHFQTKLSHAQHYVGYTDRVNGELFNRIKEHVAGRGARIIRAVVESGISFVVAATFEGDRKREREIKKQKHTSRCCPICRGEISYEEIIRTTINYNASTGELIDSRGTAGN